MIVQTLLKKGSKKTISQSVSLIAENISPGPHREMAFSKIAKYEARQGNIEGALAAACKMEQRTNAQSKAFESISDILVEKGNVTEAIVMMDKYAESTAHYYPGKVAVRLANQGKFKEALALANSIQIHRYPKHRDAAFAAIATVMARKKMANQARMIAEGSICQKNLQEVVRASINKIASHSDIDTELKQVMDRSIKSIRIGGFLNSDDLSIHCLDQLFKVLKSFGLGACFHI